jgi:hypothetical protein
MLPIYAPKQQAALVPTPTVYHKTLKDTERPGHYGESLERFGVMLVVTVSM